MSDQIETNVDEKKATPEPILTQVTSIAQEEARTGQKINVPTGEEMANKAMAGYFKVMTSLQDKLFDKTISRVSVAKAVMAAMDLPADELEVDLKTNDEKDIFMMMQSAINLRFLITQYHISQQIKLHKSQQQSEGVSTNG